MSQEEIIEGNKLLDIFMGVERIKNYGKHNNDFSYVVSIKYHESWDWIMPVVRKVNAMGKPYSCAIFKNYVSLTVEKGGKFYKDFSFSHAEYITAEQTDNEAIFRLLVKFVKWHEENTSVSNLVNS